MCATDDNECMKEPSVCTNFAKCQNLPGSYECKCDKGFMEIEAEDQCVGM